MIEGKMNVLNMNSRFNLNAQNQQKMVEKHSFLKDGKAPKFKFDYGFRDTCHLRMNLNFLLLSLVIIHSVYHKALKLSFSILNTVGEPIISCYGYYCHGSRGGNIFPSSPS